MSELAAWSSSSSITFLSKLWKLHRCSLVVFTCFSTISLFFFSFSDLVHLVSKLVRFWLPILNIYIFKNFTINHYKSLYFMSLCILLVLMLDFGADMHYRFLISFKLEQVFRAIRCKFCYFFLIFYKFYFFLCSLVRWCC